MLWSPPLEGLLQIPWQTHRSIPLPTFSIKTTSGGLKLGI